MAKQAQPLDVYTLHNVYVIEEFIQFGGGSDAEIIIQNIRISSDTSDTHFNIMEPLLLFKV